MSALLQQAGKGWKVALFVDDHVKMDYICCVCGCVCKDAVELTCKVEHEYDEIQLYCEQCLLSAISANNTNCPINNHENPEYSASRRMRGKILKANVLCPNSLLYQQQKRKAKIAHGNDAHVMDTNDHKEGIDNNRNVGCSFKGFLSDLINHVTKCSESNLNSPEMQSEIIKLLKTEVNDLKKQIKEIQNVVVVQSNMIKELQKQNVRQNERINQLEEEEKQRFNDSDKWDVNNVSKQIVVNGNSIKHTSDGDKTANLSNVVSQGIHIWKFKVIQCGVHSNLVGIWKTTSGAPIKESYFTNKNTNGYGYWFSQGLLTNASGNDIGHPFAGKYGIKCKGNDVIEMKLDFDALCLSFKVNEKCFGKAFDIERTSYRAAVNFRWKGDALTLISYNVL